MAVYMNRMSVVPELEPTGLNPFIHAKGVVDVHVGVSNPATASVVRIFNTSGAPLILTRDGASPTPLPIGGRYEMIFNNRTNGEEIFATTLALSRKTVPLVASVTLTVHNAPGNQNLAEFMCSVTTSD